MRTSLTTRRSWAPLTLLLPGAVALGLAAALLPAPRGHWSGHVLSAAAAAGQLVGLVGAAWLARRAVGAVGWIAILVIVIGLALEIGGNLQAAEPIWRTSYDDNLAALVGSTYPGFVRGHDVAEAGDLLVIAGGLALAGWLGIRRRVPAWVAVVCGVLAAFPPWVMPAVSAIVLLVWLAVRSPAGPVTAPRAGSRS
jgi:hypothetical protein